MRDLYDVMAKEPVQRKNDNPDSGKPGRGKQAFLQAGPNLDQPARLQHQLTGQLPLQAGAGAGALLMGGNSGHLEGGGGQGSSQQQLLASV